MMGIDSSTVVIDIKTLLTLFKRREDSSFRSFKETWKSLDFSYIHSSIAQGETREDFTNMLFSAALSIYQPTQSLWVRIGVTYTLYLLYLTQPGQYKFGIPVTYSIWKEILIPLHEQLVIHKLMDALSIFHRMIDEGFFNYCPFNFSEIQAGDEAEARTAQLWIRTIEHNRLSHVQESFQKVKSKGFAFEKKRNSLVDDHQDLLESDKLDFLMYHSSGLLRTKDLMTSVEYPISTYAQRRRERVNAAWGSDRPLNDVGSLGNRDYFVPGDHVEDPIEDDYALNEMLFATRNASQAYFGYSQDEESLRKRPNTNFRE